MKILICFGMIFIGTVYGYRYSELSRFNTPIVKKDKNIECRIVCEEKKNTIEEAKKAIDFYKKSKVYKFKTK